MMRCQTWQNCKVSAVLVISAMERSSKPPIVMIGCQATFTLLNDNIKRIVS